MKKILSTLLTLAFFLLIYTNADAQVTIFGAHENPDPGETVSVDILVRNFDQIVGMQFTMEWDSTVLSYLGVSGFRLNDFNSSNFGTSFISSGKLAMAWFDENLNGVTLDDSTSVFSLKFEVIGMDGDATPIDFTGSIAAIEIGDINGVLEAELIPGAVLVGTASTNTSTNTQRDFSLSQNFPNPFWDATFFPFHIEQSATINWTIFNTQGEVIYEEQRFFREGQHTIQLQQSLFPTPGVYFFQLQSPKFLATKSLIFVH